MVKASRLAELAISSIDLLQSGGVAGCKTTRGSTGGVAVAAPGSDEGASELG